MLGCSIWFSAPSFWMGGGLESRCVGRVCGADGAVHVFFIYLRTNSDLCHLQHKLIGFYNRDEKCLQRGTDWVFN